MAARVIFGVSGFIVVLLALFQFPPMVMELALAALCALATYEVIGSTKLVKNRRMLAICVATSALYAVNGTRFVREMPTVHTLIAGMLPIFLMVALFVIVLKKHAYIKATEVMYGFFGALLLPYFFLSLMRIFQMERGGLLVLMPLLAAWGSDTFALLFGILFGKHKLAPIISPKKTIEGAVGGIFGAVACLFIFTIIMHRTVGFELPYWAAVLIGVFGSVLGQVGDLSFSILKRQTEIKDYGTIFPGHGGVLDRFDSVIFVAPAIEWVLLAFGA